MIKSLLAATALAAACSTAWADQDYKLWFDNANAQLGVQVGDITRGAALFSANNAPAWACGRRVTNPATYAFLGVFGSVVVVNNVNQSGNLDTDVHLWMNRCGKSVSVEAVNGNGNGNVIAAPLGTHSANITGASSSYWVDANGDNHHCGVDCVAPGGLKALVQAPDWHAAGLVLDAARVGVLGGSGGTLQARLRLDDALQRIQALQQRTAQAVTDRRRSSFGSLEQSARAREDTALAALALATTQQDQCRRHWLALRPADGAVACSAAHNALQTAHNALRSVLDEVR